MTNSARVYLPFDLTGLAALEESGEVRADLRQGFEANPDDDVETYDALVAANEESPHQLVVEVDAAISERAVDGRVTVASAALADVVAFYSELGWFGVQEIARFVGREQ